jgi:hypothetical protein
VGQFHPYWGSEEATYENYASHLARTSTDQTPPTKEKS